MIGIGTVRYALALAVLLLHADFVTFEVAQIAVLTFFYISGFLMERSFQNYSSGKRFLYNRALRVLPTFLVVAMATWSIIRVAGNDFQRAFGFIYLREAVNSSQDSYPAPDSIARVEWASSQPYLGFESELVPQAWSIGNEMLFYLTVPLLALLGNAGLLVILSGSALFLALQIWLRMEEFDFAIYTNVFATYLFFITGYFVSLRLRRGTSFGESRHMWSGRVTLVLILLSYFLDLPDRLSPILVISYSAILITFITLGPLSANRGAEGFSSKLFGKLSYPLYISHMITIGFLNYLSILNVPILIVTSSLIAALLYLGVEKPVERLREKQKAPLRGPFE
jgi:peptidoglycan/LPS O-acetylase OafA/YrhL